MAHPRLNSIHLDNLRREEFRRARDKLLQARGELTLLAEAQGLAPDSPITPFDDSRGLFQKLEAKGRVPANAVYVLMDREAVYPLKTGLNTVGRLTDNDVVVSDPYVSRRHCAILIHAGNRCELHDVASKNGTYLNGRKLVGAAPLVPGDELRMCERQFIFMSKSDLQTPPGKDATRSL